MLYTAHVHEAEFLVTDHRRGAMIHDFGKTEVKNELAAVDFPSTDDLQFNSVTLRHLVKKFSAQFIGDAELELSEYFQKRGGTSLNVDYPDLLYFATTSGPSMSSSVTAGIGEGMAGFLVQKLYDYVPKARPLGYTPDIIMERSEPYSIALVEAKGTSITNPGAKIRTVLRAAALELIQMLAMAPYLKKAKYTGYVIGTEIVNENEFNCYVLRLEQPS